jgi:Arc/MetJ-type ribon-helix-helix transcriptional regulator
MKIPRARKDRVGNLDAALPRVFVTQQMRDWVDATAASQGVSAGDVIREAVRRMMEAK